MASTSHSIPQELRGHYRRVRNRGASGCALWGIRLFILPHTIVGLCCLFLMPASVFWAAFGTDHLARVERTWTTRGSKGSVTYHVGYAYETGGARRKGEGTVSAQTYQRVSATRPRGAEAATVRVRSIGSPPAFYEGLAEGKGGAWRTVGFLWLFGGFWNAVLSVFVFAIYVSPWRVRRLYRSGTAVVGRVVSKRSSRGSKSTNHYVKYAYETPEGGAMEQEMGVPRATYDAAKAGAAVTVLYDPRRPRRSVVYELGPHYCE